MNWNRKELRKGAWNTVFKRGTMAWLALVAVCFIFAFLGVDEFAQSTFVNGIDKAIGLDTSHVASNVEILKDYAVNTPIVKDVPFIHSDFVIGLIDVASKSQTWIIKLLGANAAYLERNTGEVIIALLLSAFIMMIVHFFIQSAAIVGKNRYAMECRYSDKVSINRMFAPFHFKHLLRLIWTMFMESYDRRWYIQILSVPDDPVSGRRESDTWLERGKSFIQRNDKWIQMEDVRNRSVMYSCYAVKACSDCRSVSSSTV